jgi:hypothetical protein
MLSTDLVQDFIAGGGAIDPLQGQALMRASDTLICGPVLEDASRPAL